MARILVPEDFGLIGIATFFITVTNVLVEGGFGAALINKKNTTQTDYSTIFFINIGFSVFLYLLLYVSSAGIASFCHYDSANGTDSYRNERNNSNLSES